MEANMTTTPLRVTHAVAPLTFALLDDGARRWPDETRRLAGIQQDVDERALFTAVRDLSSECGSTQSDVHVRHRPRDGLSKWADRRERHALSHDRVRHRRSRRRRLPRAVAHEARARTEPSKGESRSRVPRWRALPRHTRRPRRRL